MAAGYFSALGAEAKHRGYFVLERLVDACVFPSGFFEKLPALSWFAPETCPEISSFVFNSFSAERTMHPDDAGDLSSPMFDVGGKIDKPNMDRWIALYSIEEMLLFDYMEEQDSDRVWTGRKRAAQND